MKQRSRGIVGSFVLIFFAIIFILFFTTSARATADSNVRGNAITWGDSYWTLANSGELILANGEIGHAPALNKVLEDNGIDPKMVKSIEFTKPTSASSIVGMFGHLPNLQSIEGLDKLAYSGNAAQMFRGDSAIRSVDFNKFNTSKITNMTYMFWGAGFENLDLQNFNTSNVTSLYGMFNGTSNLRTLNVGNFDTGKVNSMDYLFYGSGIVELDLSGWNTSNVTSMIQMFYNCRNLDSVNVTSFDTTKVTSMYEMFSGAALTKLDLSSFKIEKIETTKMFSNARNLKQLKLGKRSQLSSDMQLPEVPSTGMYTGHWQNVGGGTIDEPMGDHIWTSAELLKNFDAVTMGNDTFIWQKRASSKINTGTVSDYATDEMLTKYVSTASKPLKPYRYNVVLNNSYHFYTKVEDGQSENENQADLGDRTGATVYNQAEMPVQYTEGDRDGEKTKYVKVSFDGEKWYWVDQHALNLDLKSQYPKVNGEGAALLDDIFLGSTATFGFGGPSDRVNSQMIDNAFNPDGKIIYKSFAKESDFTTEDDRNKALKAFNDNLDRAAKSWNDALGATILVKSSTTNERVTLRVGANAAGAGSQTLSGNTGIDSKLVEHALDPNSKNYEINLLFITMRHELGHSLGLEHSSNGQYYGMPDGYQFAIDDDVMNALFVYGSSNDYYPYTQKVITKHDINAIKLILANHNFENPQPETKITNFTKKVDRAIEK